jgi:hypothetical protein
MNKKREMTRDDVPLEFDCPQDLSVMPRVEGHIHCLSCERSVYDLSSMTQPEAQALLKAYEGEPLCVQYLCEPDGAMVFSDNQAPHVRLFRQVEGLQRLMAAALLAAPLLLAGCDTQPAASDIAPHATTPLIIQEDKPLVIDPAAARPPAPPSADSPAEANDEVVPCDHEAKQDADTITDAPEQPPALEHKRGERQKIESTGNNEMMRRVGTRAAPPPQRKKGGVAAHIYEL